MDFILSTLNNIWSVGLQGVIAGILILFFGEKIKEGNARNTRANYAKILLKEIYQDPIAWHNLSVLLPEIKTNNSMAFDKRRDLLQLWSDILLGKNYSDLNFKLWMNLTILINNRRAKFWDKHQEYFTYLDNQKFEIIHQYVITVFDTIEIILDPSILDQRERYSEIYFNLKEQSELVNCIIQGIIKNTEMRWYHIYFFFPFKNQFEDRYQELLKIYQNEQDVDNNAK